MKIKRSLLLIFLITATIALFLPFATLTFHVAGQLDYSVALSLPRLFGHEELNRSLGAVSGLLESLLKPLLLPILAYGGGALLILLSLALAWIKKGEDYIVGNLIGALILFSYVGNSLAGLPMIVDDYLTEHFGIFSVLFDLEHALVVERGLGARLLNLSLYHLIGFYLFSLIRSFLGKK